MDEGGVRIAEKGEKSENIRGYVDYRNALERIKKDIKI